MRLILRRFIALSMLPYLVGCGSGAPTPSAGAIESYPLAVRTPTPGPLFERLDPSVSGVVLTNRFDWEHEHRNLYMHGYAGGGVCIGDYDADGRPDLYLVSQTGRDALYRQVGDFRFEDVTLLAGLHDETSWGTGAGFADVDGDGDLDLYVCNYEAPNCLYINQGDGTFVESAANAGVDFNGASIMASFADYDLDGDLDCYLLTNRLYPGPGSDVPQTTQVEGRPAIAADSREAFAIQERVIDGEDQLFIVKAGQRDRLYRNDGAGQFTEVGLESGISGNHPGLSATWWDYDGDGLPDIYVGNDFWDADRLYHNQGDGTFRDVLRDVLPHTPWFSMGADVADINNDGRIDLLAADMSARTHFMSKLMMGNMDDSRWFLQSAEPRQYMRNALYLNTGSDRFMEIAFLTGLASTDWTWSVKFGDLDNDGLVDLFATNGTSNHSFDPDLTERLRSVQAGLQRGGIRDPDAMWNAQWGLFRQVPPRREVNLAFRNDGDLHFDEVSSDWGLDHNGISFGAAFGDLDRDGDLDIVVNNIEDPVSVYRNREAAGRAVVIELRGTSSNRFGLGTTVRVRTSAGTQTRTLNLTRGYMSANEPILHFGVASSATIDLDVTWPSGHRQRFDRLASDRRYVITEPGGPAPPVESVPTPPVFSEVAAEIGLPTTVTPERPYDDYARDPLIPGQYSQLGPGLAFGDVDGDGDDDLYIGGPSWQSGRLFFNDGGRFRSARGGAWAADAASEDMGALFLDVDSDGDLDLYVASGSVECDPGGSVLRDRLYLNDGSGGFAAAADDALPDARESSGVVVASDYDGDGDLDLFVGSRVIPGRYPETPQSRLLRNKGGRFTDVTGSDAPGLALAGLVTGALWSDVDGDGRPDLLLTLEWGPVRYWHNTGGRLEERTEAAGLAGRIGWFNSISGGDLDRDGDMDYVVMNAGLNTKYQVTPGHPARLYYGDFDGSGVRRHLEVKTGSDADLPVRGLSCLSSAMPVVRRRTPTFRAFAGSTLNEIFGEDLGADEALLANDLASGVLINIDGVFDWKPLPRFAQASPGYGVAITDLDGDGNPDVVACQNFFGREPETGHWDGGVGFVLRGDGRGGLQSWWPDESGFLVAGDATGLGVCDIDEDGRPDLAVTRNNARTLVYRNDGPGRSLAVRLSGSAGNPTGVGARVTAVDTEGGRQTAEVYAGSGYLSQSAPVLFFGGTINEIIVRWPDGSNTRTAVEPDARRLLIAMPGVLDGQGGGGGRQLDR